MRVHTGFACAHAFTYSARTASVEEVTGMDTSTQTALRCRHRDICADIQTYLRMCAHSHIHTGGSQPRVTAPAVLLQQVLLRANE